MKHSTEVIDIIDQRSHLPLQQTFWAKEHGSHNVVPGKVHKVCSGCLSMDWTCASFLDNAASTNKNRYLISWAMEMVEQEIVSSLHICFLMAVHTKFTHDRLFASCSKTYNKSDVFSEGELGKHYSQHSQVNVSNSDGIHPWREALKASYSDIPGIRKFHKFLIVRMGNKVSLRVGERCYDPMMIQSSLLKLNKT